ncbi:832_t:CDS:1, partial [Racocetra persica]
LTPKDLDFVVYLEEKGKVPEWCLNYEDMSKLREEYINGEKIRENVEEDKSSVSASNTSKIELKKQTKFPATHPITEQTNLQPPQPVLLKPDKNSSQPLTAEQNQVSDVQSEQVAEPESVAQIETNNNCL